MVLAAIAAAGALATAGAGIASASSASAQGQKQYELTQQGQADARNNEAYQRAQAALINQRSIAGSADSFGSTLQYDPATNQWVSKLGQLPFAAQTAADQAGIQRNTTDLRQAQLANEVAARRATQAGPAADAAMRELTSFKPKGADELIGLLQQQATHASDASFRPLVADTLRSFQRSGTAAGPVLAALGKQQADTLRDSLIDAQIKGMTSVDQINQGRRQGLEQTAANTATLANPQFQYPGINATDKSNTMANLVAQRAQQGGIAPAYGMGGVNTASAGSQAALKALAGQVPGDTHPGEAVAKQIGAALSNKDLANNLSTAYKGFFGPDPNAAYQQAQFEAHPGEEGPWQ